MSTSFFINKGRSASLCNCLFLFPCFFKTAFNALQKRFYLLCTRVAVVTCCRQFLWQAFMHSKPSLLFFCKQPVLSWPCSTSSFQLSCSPPDIVLLVQMLNFLFEQEILTAVTSPPHFTALWQGCNMQAGGHVIPSLVCLELHYLRNGWRYKNACTSSTELLLLLHIRDDLVCYKCPARLLNPGSIPRFQIWSSRWFQVLSIHRNIPSNASSCVEQRRPRKTFQPMWNQDIMVCLRK